MADITRLKGELRTEFGKGASRRLRRDFRVPAARSRGHPGVPGHPA